MTEIQTIFQSFVQSQQTWDALGKDKQTQLTTGVNKAYGQAKGFYHEYLRTVAAENKTNRRVQTQVYADVTEGEADELFAKSSECKSVTKPEKSAVNKIIGDALKQLGSIKRPPRDKDVRIVDVSIFGAENPWPYPGGVYGFSRIARSLAPLLTAVKTEISTLIAADKAGPKSIRGWLNGQSYDDFVMPYTLRSLESTSHPNSSRQLYLQTNDKFKRIRCLTVKIRYDTPYLLADACTFGHIRGLQEVLVQAFRKEGQMAFDVTVAKVKIIEVVTVTQQSQVTRQDGAGNDF